jgi:hypothetical protein
MRINELLEGFNFDEKKFVDRKGDNNEINFDLAEDLIHFMHNDDDVYRRHLYPSLAKCLDNAKAKRPTKMGVFKPAVESSYKIYSKKFPIKALPSSLDEELLKEICEKLHEEFKDHVSNGKYKD